MYWSVREPSVEAKNFCSFWKARLELAKLAPLACMAASFIASRKAILRSVGTSKGSCSKLLRQVAVTRGAGATRPAPAGRRRWPGRWRPPGR